MSSHILFYHYTSSKGLKSIKACGYIRKSSHSSNHAWYGEGTYGTSLHPRKGKHRIATNNWRHCGVRYIQNGKMDWAIELKIPRRQVEIIRCGRDILRHDGPIYLEDYEWRAIKVPDPSSEFNFQSFYTPPPPVLQPVTYSAPSAVTQKPVYGTGTSLYSSLVNRKEAQLPTAESGGDGYDVNSNPNPKGIASTGTRWIYAWMGVGCGVLALAGYFFLSFLKWVVQ